MSSFPRTLADLKAEDPFISSPSIYTSLKELRKSALSVPNRLRSILADAEFVKEVASAYQLPVIANERCGSWYIPPETKAGSAYFKSTDGHTGQWSLSLRRLNLQVLDVIGTHKGCIIVDSTRRGKAMPDAFSKTVPIWCAVMNRVLFPEEKQFHGFQRPGVELPESEIAQIESRLDGFVEAFLGLRIDLISLRNGLGRPMRLKWVVGHSTAALPANERNLQNMDAVCHNVILCSASRRVEGAEMSEGGYIQGAGDDSEGWSQGLEPLGFWNNKDMLLQAQEDELPDLIQKLPSYERAFQMADSAVLIEPTNNVYVGSWKDHRSPSMSALIINCHNSEAVIHRGLLQLNLRCESGKLGGRNLRHKLQDVKSCVEGFLRRDPASHILITCETGKDLSVGIALMLLCSFYLSNGMCVYELISKTNSRPKVDKGFIRQRLAWIISSKPDANPSRSTLQSVNAFLMDRP